MNILHTYMRLSFLIALAFGPESLCGIEAVDPNVVTILQGIESARLQIPASELALEATYRAALRETRHKVTARFDGDRRRFDRMDDGNRSKALFNGVEVTLFDGADSCTLRDLSKQTADYNFDPRLLGITTTYWWKETLSTALPYRDAKAIKLVGSERIGTNDTWHVQVIDPHDRRVDVWVADTGDFRVLRYELSLPRNRRNETVSFYEDPNYHWLPTRVESRCYSEDGRLDDQRTFLLSKAAVIKRADESVWTLAGLNLPVGTPVSDLRLKERIGYWDGKGLSRLPPPSSRSEQSGVGGWGSILILAFVAAPVVVLLVRNAKRAGTAS